MKYLVGYLKYCLKPLGHDAKDGRQFVYMQSKNSKKLWSNRIADHKFKLSLLSFTAIVYNLLVWDPSISSLPFPKSNPTGHSTWNFV